MPSQSPRTAKPYQLTNMGGGKAALDIRGIIGIPQDEREWGANAAGTVIDFDRDLKALGNPTEIEMNIHSDGGLVWVALGLHDILVRHPARIVANVDGIAASAATIVLMAADEIRVPANSYLFIHDPEMPVHGNHRDVAAAAAKLKQWARDLANTYTDRIEDTKGGSRPEILANVIRLMEEETYLTGRQAVELGLADRVTEEINLAACAPSACTLSRPSRPLKVPGAIRHLFDSSITVTDPNPTPTNMSDNAPAPAPAPAANTTPAPAAPAAPAATPPAAPAADTDPSTTAPTAPTPAAPAAPAPAPAAAGAAPADQPTNAAPGAAAPDLSAIVSAAVTAAIAPLETKVTALQQEVDTQKKLAAAGVGPTAWGGNQPPAPAPRSGDPASGPVDFNKMSPRALIKLGRERMAQQK